MNSASRLCVTLPLLLGSCGCHPHESAPAPEASTRSSLPGVIKQVGEEQEIEVYDVVSARPMPAVDVCVLGDWRQSDDLTKIDSLLAHPDAVVRSDARGIARLVVPDDGVYLYARTSTRFGRMLLTPFEAGVCRLRMTPDVPFRIQVVDGVGSPVVGVPVALRAVSSWGSNDLIVARSSAPEGIAVVPHADHYAREYFGTDPRPPLFGESHFFAALALTLGEPVQEKLAGNQVPGDVIKLVLPPTGEVEVRCLEPDGKSARVELPLVMGVHSQVDRDRMEHQVQTSGWSGVLNSWVWRSVEGDLAGRSRATLENGRALFAWVGLGQALDIGCVRNGGSTWVETTVQGPTAPGERVVVELTCAKGKATFSGRAVRKDHTAIANAELTAELFCSPPSDGTSESEFNVGPAGELSVDGPMRIHTDSDGLFKFDLDPWDSSQSRHDLTVMSGRLTAGACGFLRTLENGSPGAHEFGDVVFERAPVMFAGQVTDDVGVPIPHAHLLLQPEKHHWWRWNDATLEDTDIDGRFVARAFDVQPSYRPQLTARAAGFGSLSRGEGKDDGMHLVLPRGGDVKGRLLLPADADVTRLSMFVEGSTNGWGQTRLRSDGAFLIHGVSPGHVKLAVCSFQPGVASSSHTVTTREVEVRLGEPTEIAPIDLRDSVGVPR